MALSLRPYQHDLIAQCRASMQRGNRRVLIQSSTGSGKTITIAQMLASIAARGKRAWFCVHRKELLEQSVATFIESADIHTGVIAVGYPSAPLAPVQVCSVPSLARRAASLSPPDVVVWDECHHVASRSWSGIAGLYPSALHIGLTATPLRLDGRGLGAYFDDLIVGPTTAELMNAGYLSRYEYFAPSTVSMQDVHSVGGDYNKKEAASVLEQSTVVGDAVSHYRRHGGDGRALVFAWSIEASQGIAESFRAAGVSAEHVDGETARATRTDTIRRFHRGDVRVLCNVDLFGEGLDIPSVEAVFLLRPTASLGLYLQQVGRGLRPAEGKQTVRIFDHVNNWQRHGLPDDPRVWTLTADRASRRTSEPMGKRCGVCFGVSRVGATRCALCGLPFPVQAREVKQVKGELQAVDVDVLRQLGFAGHAAPPTRVCQRCGKPCEKRFCGSACYLAARRLWKRSA